MGAWSFEVLENDSALDILDEFMYSPNLLDTFTKYLNANIETCNGIDEKLLAVAIVDISINGIDESILGCYEDNEEWFQNLSDTPLLEYLPAAITTLQYIKENDDGWVEEVKSQREQLLLKLEERLQKAFVLHEDEYLPPTTPQSR